MLDGDDFVELTDNPFIGEPDAEELLIKHQAVERIEAEMKDRGVSVPDLAKLAQLSDADLVEMLQRKLTKFTVERVEQVLEVFDLEVVRHYEIRNRAA